MTLGPFIHIEHHMPLSNNVDCEGPGQSMQHGLIRAFIVRLQNH